VTAIRPGAARATGAEYPSSHNGELEVGDAGRRDYLRPLKLDGRLAEMVEQPLPAPQQHRHQGDVDLVEEPGPQVLLDDAGSAADRHVLVARGGAGLVQGGLDPVGNEGERRAAFFDQRLSRAVGYHEDRHVEGRVFAPRSL